MEKERIQSKKRPYRIVYIAGAGRSGSTLLGRLLGGHPHAFFPGELKVFSPTKKLRGKPTRENRRCGCGVNASNECRFWEDVTTYLKHNHQLGLWTNLEVHNGDTSTFRFHNLALYDAIHAISKAPFIIDSSKSHNRLEKLLASQLFDIRVIYLQRNPYGVVYSNLKLGRDLRYYSRHYAQNYYYTRKLLKGHDHHYVRYEKLVENPGKALKDIMSWLGLSYDPAQLNWKNSIFHIIAGNKPRMINDQPISPDNSWREQLTIREKIHISRRSLPGYMANIWRYEKKPALLQRRAL